jgi:DNA-binding SARP family transcriptional activator
VEIRLLGPLEVGDRAGRPVPLPRQKQRALLAALALRPGAVVSTDRLLEDLWGEEPPRTAVGSLQNLVSQLRKSLGADVLVTRPPGYVLAVAPEDVDVGRFEALIARARQAGRDEQPDLLRAALALFRGPPLADVAFEPFAGSEVQRLDELRVAAAEDLAAAELARGRHTEVLAQLESLVAENPLRERPRALLMLALHRAGRRADALDLYLQTWRYFDAELGIEPSAAVKKLHQAILDDDPLLDAPAAAAPLLAEERRITASVLFADLVDSTALAERLDPEAYRSLLRRYYRAARAVLERHGGTVEKFIGDAIVAVFGVPVRREDDALRAVRAAVEVRAAVAELELETRIGVNTGEAVAGEPEGDASFATGYAVNVAAKLQQAAPPGEILIGAATYRLVRDAVAATAVDPIPVGAGIPAYRLGSVDPDAPGVARHLRAPLVGRDEELEALRGCFDGEARVVTVLGEAGIGKTRLANELAASVADEARVLVGRCVSYGEGATWLPLAEIVRAVVPDASEAGIAALLGDEDDARLVARRVRELLGLEEGAPPAGEGFWAVRRLLEALARERPLLVVLEDIHWAEPTLLDLVEHLAAQASGPLLVLCLARDLDRDWPVAVRLTPLPDDEATSLVAALPGGAALDEPLRRRIVELAEGNPLFAEQLLAHALESGEDALAAVPGSVEALIAARLDRLPPDERGVLERAAVVGREFPAAAVADLSEREVAEDLAALGERGLVRAARRGGFRFHHVLIRDVAYAGITKERRSKLHERVAAWLDAAGGADDAIVGYHLEHAYALRAQLGPVDDAGRALAQAAGERLGGAGIDAWKRADSPAAVNLLARAASLLPAGEAQAEFLCELAVALWAAGEGSRTRATLEQALAVASATGSRRTELRAQVELAYAGLYGVGGLRASPDEALAAASAAISVLEELGDDRALGRTWLAIADVRTLRLRFDQAGEAHATALRHYRRTGFSPAVCLTGQAAALQYGPMPVLDALRRCDELLEEAERDRQATANVQLFAAVLRAMQQEFETAREMAAVARATFEDHGARYVLAATVDGQCAEIERLAGDHGAAESYLRASLAALDEMGQAAYAATRCAELADLLAELGRVDEAELFAERAEAECAEHDVANNAYWRSARGRLLALRGKVSEAEACTRRAVELLADTDALNIRAKAALDLAEALRAAGRAPEEVAGLIDEAAQLYGRKGNLVGAARAGALLAEPAGAPR